MLVVLCSTHLKKVFNLVVIFTLSGAAVLAQSVINTKTFFALTSSEGNIETAVIGPVKAKMPWVESYELRTETRDFDVDKQEYTLRLSPSTRRKYRAQTALYRHQETAPDFEADELACDGLAQRYNDWLQLYLISREIALLDRLVLVLKDRAVVLSRLAGSLDFEWSELISLQEDQTDLKLRRVGLARKQTDLTTAYGITGDLRFSDMADLRELQGRLLTTQFNYEDVKTAYELEQIARELELERAEQRQFIDFAQVKYQGPHDDPARERFSVGFGLQLPVSGNQIIKVRELELEEAALRQETSREKTLEQGEYLSQKSTLLADFDQYKYVDSVFVAEQKSLSMIADQLRKKGGFNPLPLLKIKERALQNELRQLGLAERLYEDYLDQAELSGGLCASLEGELLLK